MLLSPADVARRLNDHLCKDATDEQQFFTLLYGILELATGTFRFVSAGHPELLHVRVDQTMEFVAASGLPIGLTETVFDEQTLSLTPGDRLYIYSDGVPEAMNADNEQFTADRLARVIDQNRKQPLATGLEELLRQVSDWGAAEGLKDDVSLLAFEYLGP